MAAENFAQLTNNMFKNIYRNEMQTLVDIMKKIKLPENNYDINEHNQTFLIEFRVLPHVEYLIRRMRVLFPNWKHSIICGPVNYSSMKKIADDIGSVNVISYKQDIKDRMEYSNLCLTPELWLSLTGKKVLLYQEDSNIFHNNITPFINCNYIGAPWQHDAIGVRGWRIGNGGFSLRDRKMMVDFCIKYKNNDNDPEDVFFSKCIFKNRQLGYPNAYTALQFAQESIKSPNPLGGHQYWIADVWPLSNNQSVNISKIKTKTCGGLKQPIMFQNSLLTNSELENILIKSENKLFITNILFISNCKEYFIDKELTINNDKWCGIIKDKSDFDALTSQNCFNNSLPNCIQLFSIDNINKQIICINCDGETKENIILKNTIGRMVR